MPAHGAPTTRKGVQSVVSARKMAPRAHCGWSRTPRRRFRLRIGYASHFVYCSQLRFRTLTTSKIKEIIQKPVLADILDSECFPKVLSRFLQVEMIPDVYEAAFELHAVLGHSVRFASSVRKLSAPSKQITGFWLELSDEIRRQLLKLF